MSNGDVKFVFGSWKLDVEVIHSLHDKGDLWGKKAKQNQPIKCSTAGVQMVASSSICLFANIVLVKEDAMRN